MKAKITISGEIGWEITSLDIRSKIEALPSDLTELEVDIYSCGGGCIEGWEIFRQLEAIKSRGVHITTTTIRAWSIASVIFMVGDSRIAVGSNPLMIHLPWVEWASGDASELERLSTELRSEEQQIAELYARVTSMPYEEVMQMMRNETFMSADTAVAQGFATSSTLPLHAVAKFSLKNNTMTKIKNEVTLQSAEGVSIVFPEVSEGVAPKVGDAATVDGEPIADGEYIMPSLDNATVTFEGGKVVEIEAAEVEEVETTEVEEVVNELTEEERQEMENLRAENERLRGDLTRVEGERDEAQRERDELAEELADLKTQASNVSSAPLNSTRSMPKSGEQSTRMERIFAAANKRK